MSHTNAGGKLNSVTHIEMPYLGVDVLSWNQAIRDFITLHKEVFGDGRDDQRTAVLAKRIDELVADRLGS